MKFSEIIGQEAAIDILKKAYTNRFANAIRTDIDKTAINKIRSQLYLSPKGFFVGIVTIVIPKNRANEVIKVPTIKINFKISGLKYLAKPNPI